MKTSREQEYNEVLDVTVNTTENDASAASVQNGQAIPKYQDIDPLYKVGDILSSSWVVVTEKIHGTNARVGIVDGKKFYGGRNLLGGSAQGFDVEAAHILEQLEQRGINNLVIYGEWCGPGIQRGVNYGDKKIFVVFDLKSLTNSGRWINRGDLETFCFLSGLEVVPKLYEGKPSLAVFDALKDQDSVLGFKHGVTKTPNLMEGIVVRSEPDLFDAYGHRVLAKYKNAAFAEVRGEPKIKGELMVGNDAQVFVETFVTSARMQHALDGLREQGVDVSSLSVMPFLIKGVITDLRKEAGEELSALGENERFLGKLIPARLRDFLIGELTTANWDG